MKILIIGSGGREHCLGVALSKNPNVKQLFFCSGNAGTTKIGKNIEAKTIDEILQFAKHESIDLTIVGSEQMLVEGIVDIFQKANLNIFGPDQRSAMLEGSKIFSKHFMKKHNIPTARYEVFDDVEKAKNAIDNFSYPVVIKANGLAAGKGVLIIKSKQDAIANIEAMMLKNKFGDAGKEIVIEEFLDGFEVSLLSFYNGKEIFPMLSAKDHKKIGEGNTGLNTGGMGVVVPNPLVTPELEKDINDLVIQRTLKGLLAENILFKGVIFFGLMITQKGVFVLEYNLRLGDPETQAVLPLLTSDLLENINECMNGKQVHFSWKRNHVCCVVASSKGYPESYPKGYEIKGLGNLSTPHFIAGAELDNKNNYITSGGRVLNIVGIGETLQSAQQSAYQEMNKIFFEGMYFRKDIGKV